MISVLAVVIPLLLSSVQELTEEQEANYDKYVDAARCQACEELVEFVERKMNKTSRGRKLKELDAIEFLDLACEGKATKSIHYCEEGVDKFGDDITEYIKNNEYDKSFKDKTCTTQCEIKTEMKATLDNMNTDFEDQVAGEMGNLILEVILGVVADYWIHMIIGFTAVISLNVWLIKTLERLRQEQAARDGKAD